MLDEFLNKSKLSALNSLSREKENDCIIHRLKGGDDVQSVNRNTASPNVKVTLESIPAQ